MTHDETHPLAHLQRPFPAKCLSSSNRLAPSPAEALLLSRIARFRGRRGNATEIAEIVGLLLSPMFPVQKGDRLLGVTLLSLDAVDNENEPQLALAL
ncbi:hypothetical protein [Rhizobium sp. AP16]|uniref:hypothetical protein n=1 Tax=Rhizobium sp. AP16 TaxID=1144306 RepID=UPI0038F6895A